MAHVRSLTIGSIAAEEIEVFGEDIYGCLDVSFGLQDLVLLIDGKCFFDPLLFFLC